MIELQLPLPLLWALRWLLFLGPLSAVMIFGWRSRQQYRALVGALFAFLYGLGLIFVTHQLAFFCGWWRYGGETLMFMGLPTDVWIGGALFFGPVLFLAFPRLSPFVLLVPIVTGLHGSVFLSLRPFVLHGPYWYAGVLFVFAAAHLPALYLAHWTLEDRLLPLRATLIALGYGCVAFIVLPSVIMQAMGGTWSLLERPPVVLIGGGLLFSACCVLGLTAVQIFVVEGQGTPIPLDPTRRLVTSGIFAFIRNPMQLCTALAWIIEGVVLENIWVASASLMAWVFVAGMVRWHHRYDLLLRFPGSWTAYTAEVPEWRPRWRPWIEARAHFQFDPGNRLHSVLATLLARVGVTGLDIVGVPASALRYSSANADAPSCTGLVAAAYVLDHTNFALAMFSAAAKLVLLPGRYLLARFRRPTSARLGRVR